MSPEIDPTRVIADLRELDRRTGGADGARRVCWTPAWADARAFLEELLDEIGVTPELDEAGNLWAYLEGEAEPALAVGSHIDSVPQGGWLDGALGTMAAVGLLRSWAQAGERPPRTIALVDWADEEGRFGRSLLGSSAASGTLQPDEVRGLRDADGHELAEVLEQNGIELDEAPAAASRLQRLGGLLELHIEQGPVLESEGLPIAAVSGTAGIERLRFRIEGRASHAGTTPMDQRRDAGLIAAQLALEAERIALQHSGVATAGSLELRPGAPTVIPGEADVVIDLRNTDLGALSDMLDEIEAAAQALAGDRGCECFVDRIWRIDPIGFDPELVELARQSCDEVAGSSRVLVSGALHDAAEIASRLPAAMLFVRSIGGISHSPQENSSDEDLELGIRAYAELAERAMQPG